MRRILVAIAALTISGVPAAADDIDFEYAFELATGGTVARTSFIKGFQKGQPLTLQVKLKDTSYVYFIHEEDTGYRLTYPDPKQKQSSLVKISEQVPPIKIVHLTRDPEVERLVLVVSKERISEFEDLLAKGKMAIPAGMILDVRDRYYSPGLYTRDIREDSVKVEYKSTGTKPAVVEEISLRPRGALPTKPKS